jgi:hypothetical protein
LPVPPKPLALGQPSFEKILKGRIPNDLYCESHCYLDMNLHNMFFYVKGYSHINDLLRGYSASLTVKRYEKSAVWGGGHGIERFVSIS